MQVGHGFDAAIFTPRLFLGGLDYGGLAREWFFLLSHEVFDVTLGMFSLTKDYTLQINRASASVDDHLLYFQFVGRILGLALLHRHFIDHSFTRTFYKNMLGLPITLRSAKRPVVLKWCG